MSSTLLTKREIPRAKNLPAYKTYLIYRKDPLKFFSKLTQEYGEIVRFRMGPFPIVLINSPELVNNLLVDHPNDFDKSGLQRGLFRPLVGNGLLNSEGKLHHQQRKLMAPHFQPRHICGYADTMVSYADEAQDEWEEGEIIELGKEMMEITLNIVSKIMLDTEISGEADQLGQAIELGLQWSKYSTTSLFPLPLFVPTPRSLRTRKAIAYIKQKIQTIIDERREAEEDRGDLLSVFLGTRDEDGNEMSDSQIHDETATIFLAGHETTARALSWAFYLLATHPEIYAKVQNEVDNVLKGKPATYATVPHLPYTLQVLKEALRLYPPSSIIFRGALRNTELGSYPIPKGTIVMFSQYLMHHRPDNFPHPERFEPERFTPENEQKLPRHAYIPFGAGHRVCIGNHFALMEGQLVLATIIQKVHFQLLHPQPIQPELVVTLRPKGGIKMRVARRD